MIQIAELINLYVNGIVNKLKKINIMADKNKPVPGSTKVKRNGKWVSITDTERDKLNAKAAEKAKDPNASYKATPKKAPVSILKGVNRRDEIGKPASPMVLKKPSAAASSTSVDSKSKTSTPSRATVITSKSNSPAPSKTTISSSKKTVGGSKSSSNRITKPAPLSRSNPVYTNAKDLSVKTEGLKRTNPVGKTAEVKNVSLPSLSSTASKSSTAPLSQRAKLKGLRKEKRSERKATRMARRENRIVNKTAKLKSKR
jgi:hypothetical protein